MIKKDMPEPLVKVLKEMCRRVGADFDKIDFQEQDWYQKYSWTEKEDNEFKEWLKNRLKEDKETRELFMGFSSADNEYYLNKVVNMFMLNYGWSLKDE